MFIKFHLDEEKLPNFFSHGKWRLWAQIRDGNVTLSAGVLNFEIVGYSSEKQKKKLG